MKAFLRGILTICLVFLLVIFGVVINMKEVLVGTTEHLVKQELKKSIGTFASQYTDQVSNATDIIQKVEDQIDNNEMIKKVIDTYYDEIIDVLKNKEVHIQIDLSKELDDLISDGEKILSDYGITITEEEKQELLSKVSTDTVNEFVNETITDMKTSLNGDAKVVLDSYLFVTSNSFKIMLCSFILLAVLCIALLKKSYYKWLSNFGGACVLSGFITGVLFPVLADVIEKMMEEYGFVLSMTSIGTYGYILIGFGILSCVVSFVISKYTTKDTD